MKTNSIVFTLLLLLLIPSAIYADEATTDDSDPADSTVATEDQQSSEQAQSAAKAVGFATNKPGDMDKHATDSNGDKIIWKHKLPIFAQKVIDKGFGLPLPYGVSAIYTNVLQELALSDLRISFGDPDQPQTEVPFVTFEPSIVDVNAYNLKADMWLFPFLNVFMLGNHLSGDGVIPIVVPGEDILKVLAPPIGARCDKPPGHLGRPALCDEDLVLIDHPKYTGETLGVGIILPMGWKNFFAAIPLSYTWSETSNTNGKVTAFQASLRMGFYFKPKRTGQVALYVGSTYLDTEQDVFGVFPIDTGVPELGTIDINYTIHQGPADKVNYLAGFNWVITERWWLQAELGFGGKRDDVIASLSYRW